MREFMRRRRVPAALDTTMVGPIYETINDEHTRVAGQARAVTTTRSAERQTRADIAMVKDYVQKVVDERDRLRARVHELEVLADAQRSTLKFHRREVVKEVAGRVDRMYRDGKLPSGSSFIRAIRQHADGPLG